MMKQVKCSIFNNVDQGHLEPYDRIQRPPIREWLDRRATLFVQTVSQNCVRTSQVFVNLNLVDSLANLLGIIASRLQVSCVVRVKAKGIW